MSNQHIKRIVIWGLKHKYHTHRHIHQAFYKNAKKLGYTTIWLEDEKKNAGFISPGDLIISADPIGKMVSEKFTFEEYNIPIRNDVYYCLHNFKPVFIDKVPKDRCVFLQVYNTIVNTIPHIEKWGPVTYFDPASKTLYQPWGTDLLSTEFRQPVFNANKFVFWIGSIWDDALNRGNLHEISELKNTLKKHNLKFLQLRFIPDFLNIFFIRRSRIAPAIAGRFQTEVDYLPCRMFKNISYGQLGITNIQKFKDILGDSFIGGDTIDEIIHKALSLSKTEYFDIIKKQQEIIKSYTYENALNNILKTLHQYEN